MEESNSSKTAITPARIVTVMDTQDDMLVCAFPVSDYIGFNAQEKLVLYHAQRQLKRCANIYICDAARTYNDGYIDRAGLDYVEPCIKKIKCLLESGAILCDVIYMHELEGIKTLDSLNARYWKKETALQAMGFKPADTHATRLAWLDHLQKHY